MKNIKVNYLTLYFLLIYLICGYIKIGLIIFFIVLIHELGHVFIAKLLNYKIIKVEIYPFGGITKLEKDINTNINKEILLAFGGIFFQIILFVILKIINNDFSVLVLKYNISIMVFNMIPIIPLDGSIILNMIINKFIPYKKAYLLNIYISLVFILIYIFINHKYNLNNYLIIGLFIFKIYEYIKNYKYIYNRFLLERFLKAYKLSKISTKKGDIDILKLDTYQYFKEGEKIINEKEKLRRIFDN